MNWFSIIKENRLVSENITHTKVNEQDPEQDDDKCKKALIHFVETMDAYLDALGSDYFEWRMFDLHKCIKIIESFPERRCCQILEKMRGVKNKSNPESINLMHYGYLGQNFMMRMQSKDHIEETLKENLNDKKYPNLDLMFFVVNGSAESIHPTEHAWGAFSIKDETDWVLSEELQETWGRVFDTIMGLIP